MRRYRALYAHFRQQPPTHWLLAAFVEYKPPPEGEAPSRNIDIGDLLDMLPEEEGKPKVLTLDHMAILGML